MKLTFLVFSSNEYMNRTNVCLASIKKYHSEAEIILEKISNLDDLAKNRLKKVRQLLLENKDRNVVLLGADCVLYSRLDEFEGAFEKAYGMILVPHVITPPHDRAALIYQTGYVNADIVGFSADSLSILNWLIDQKIVNDPKNGIFYEQTWLSAVPFVYNNVYICRDPGYNLAWFNLHERSVSFGNDKYYVNGSWLKVAHFTGFVSGRPEKVSRHYSGEIITGDTLKLFTEYNEAIN